VEELLEIEVEHRLWGAHANAGYAKASPVAFVGQGGGAGHSRDRVERAAERYRAANPWRGLSLALLSPLPERQRRAALVSQYIIPPTKALRRSPRMLTAGEACEPERQAKLFQRLGWSPGPAPMFKDAGSLQNATCTARRKMRKALEEHLAATLADGADPGRVHHACA